MPRGFVVIVMKAELRRISQLEKILNINIGDKDILFTVVEDRIQLTVRFLLKHRQVDQIVLNAVCMEAAEQTGAKIEVVEHKLPEVTAEPLDAGLQGYEIIVVADVEQMFLDRQLLERDVCFCTIVSFPHIDVDAVVFTRVDVIEIEHRGHLDFPITGSESHITVVELKAEPQVFVHEDTISPAEEFLAHRINCADAARGRRPYRLRKIVHRCSRNEERIQADDRIIAFEDVLIIGIVPVSFDIELVRWRCDVSPAVRHWHEILQHLPCRVLPDASRVLGEGNGHTKQQEDHGICTSVLHNSGRLGILMYGNRTSWKKNWSDRISVGGSKPTAPAEAIRSS